MIKNRVTTLLLLLVALFLPFSGRAQEKIRPYVDSNSIIAQDKRVSDGSLIIEIPSTKSSGGTFTPQIGNISSIYQPVFSLSISGSLTFHSVKGLFKAVAYTEDGNELLIYRDLGRFHTVGQPISLQQVAFETALYTGGH